MRWTRQLALFILALAAVIGAPETEGVASAQPAATPTAAAAPALRTVGFTVRESLDSTAPRERLSAVIQDPAGWMPNLVSRSHVSGPDRGLGAVHLVTTEVQGSRIQRLEQVILSKPDRLVLRAETGAPAPGITIIDFELLPAAAGTRIQITIFVNVDRNVFGSATAEQVTALLQQLVQANRAILQGHLAGISERAFATN